MKRKTKMMLSAGVMLSLTLYVRVAAAERTATSEKPSTTLEQRIEVRKNAAKVRINATERLLIQNRCKASQAHLHRLGSRIIGISVSRRETYDNAKDRLLDLSKKLQAKGITTTDLDGQVATLETKMITFYEDLDNYEQVVEDLSTMDCATDPEGYRASLEEAKKIRAKAVEAGRAIHLYLKDTIKPTLQNLRKQVGEVKEGTNGQ